MPRMFIFGLGYTALRIARLLGEAESELIAGYNLEYGSVKFAMFAAAEYVSMIVISAFAATLFLGGPDGPWLPGFINRYPMRSDEWLTAIARPVARRMARVLGW